MASRGNGFLESTFGLEHEKVLITGASSGFGEHFAKVYAKAGCKVLALLARRTQKLEDLAEHLRSEHQGIKVVTVKCDVGNVKEIVQAFDEAESAIGGECFNVVVNNAGVGPATKLFDQTEDEYDWVMGVNLKGAYFVAQEAARRMIKGRAKNASIINISSIFALRVAPGHSVYSASKAGLTHLTKAMANELARDHVRVNSVNPGYYRTELTQDYYDSPKGKVYLDKHVPLKRLGQLEELDGVMLLLASQASRFMYGSVITVDGGHAISSL
mmetsp:Transcript_8339/g.14765  ORF Transcript_8339/g.14765 Transcript_8339/m.14765 type:complete len:271 (+) Transcript_8339:163-975(+)